MGSIRVKFNYAYRTLYAGSSAQTVGVYLSNGEVEYKTWLGFIDQAVARRISEAIPVKLQAEQFSDDDTAFRWADIPPGKYIQGCVVGQGVYGVTQTKIKLV